MMLSHAIIESMKPQIQLALDHMVSEIGVKITPKNEGRQLVIYRGDQVVDFWPASGKWYNRSTQTKGQGIQRLRRSLEPQIGRHTVEEDDEHKAEAAEPAVERLAPRASNKNDGECGHCDKASSIGVHGIYNGGVVSRYYCAGCFVKKYKLGIASSADIRRLTDEE